LRVSAVPARVFAGPSYNWAARPARRPSAVQLPVGPQECFRLRIPAHLLVLSLILAIVPSVVRLADSSTQWVEDVGSLESVDTDSALPTPITVEVGPVLELGPAEPAEQSAGPTRGPLKLRSYAMKAGDTVGQVADSFGLDAETLIWANDLADPDLVAIGTKLVVPPAIGVLHRVRPGDTLADLANYYSSDVQKTVEVNGLESPYVIMAGQRLLLPEGKMPPPRRGSDAVPSARSDLAASAEARKPLPSPIGASGEQASFILTAARAARESQLETGVPASVTVAQAILESFWGSSRLARENNNYFGIKAKEHPGTAGVTWFNVWEVIGGANIIQSQPFRAYNRMAESFIDHGHFFQQNPRYAAALAASGDPRQFAREINAAGYATDPGYAAKLIGLMDRFNLYAYDQ
jgi:LysM repeat protein